jgi:hypothetical protein
MVNFLSSLPVVLKAFRLTAIYYYAILTFYITPWSRVLLPSSYTQLDKKFPTFYGTQRFITMFTRAHHQSLS